MSNTTFSSHDYCSTAARRGILRGWPLLAVSLTALLGACASQGSGTDDSPLASAASPDAQFPVAQNTDTDSRSFIPPEDITRNGDGRALMWRTGTPVPEFGDSSF